MKFSLCKQQYIYLALAIVCLALAITTRVFAQEPTVAETNGADASAARSALSVEVQNRIVNLSQNVTNKMQAAIARLEQIIDRIDSRTRILKEGAETQKIEDATQSARNSLTYAKNKLPVLNATIIEQVSSENPGAAFTNIKSEFVLIRDAIRNAHSILVYTVTLLKETANGGVVQSEQGEDIPDTTTGPDQNGEVLPSSVQ